PHAEAIRRQELIWTVTSPGETDGGVDALERRLTAQCRIAEVAGCQTSRFRACRRLIRRRKLVWSAGTKWPLGTTRWVTLRPILNDRNRPTYHRKGPLSVGVQIR